MIRTEYALRNIKTGEITGACGYQEVINRLFATIPDKDKFEIVTREVIEQTSSWETAKEPEMTIRERILAEKTPYPAYSSYKDLTLFSVRAEYFCTYDDTERGREPDFDELTVVVEKDWLYETMEKEGIQNPHKYLQNEYTSDDSIGWYEEAIAAHKVVVIEFN